VFVKQNFQQNFPDLTTAPCAGLLLPLICRQGREIMAFSDRMRELLDQGAHASKEFLSKAGAKAQDLGERGALALEIKQLESQARKLLERLGNEVYRLLAEEGEDSITAATPAIKDILAELASLKASIEKRENELRQRKR
jgi:hypothetical protein